MQQMNGHCFGGARARLDRETGRRRQQAHACGGAWLPALRRRCGAAQLVEALDPLPAGRRRRPTNSLFMGRLKVSAGASHAPQQIMLCAAYSLAARSQNNH